MFGACKEIIHPLAQAHRCTHSHTHAHTCMHGHTHAHTHTQSPHSTWRTDTPFHAKLYTSSEVNLYCDRCTRKALTQSREPVKVEAKPHTHTQTEITHHLIPGALGSLREMGRQNIIPEHEQQEMGFVLPPPPRETDRGNEQQQDDG